MRGWGESADVSDDSKRRYVARERSFLPPPTLYGDGWREEEEEEEKEEEEEGDETFPSPFGFLAPDFALRFASLNGEEEDANPFPLDATPVEEVEEVVEVVVEEE